MRVGARESERMREQESKIERKRETLSIHGLCQRLDKNIVQVPKGPSRLLEIKQLLHEGQRPLILIEPK